MFQNCYYMILFLQTYYKYMIHYIPIYYIFLCACIFFYNHILVFKAMIIPIYKINVQVGEDMCQIVHKLAIGNNGK